MEKLNNLSDEDLVEYIRQKDSESYRELVVRYQDRLLRYAKRLLNGDEKAQDAVQQAFIKAYINLQSFDTSKKFSSWMYRIVHNESMNLITKANKETLVESDILAEEKDTSETVDQMLINIERDELLAESVEELPIEYKAVITLSFFEEKSYDEISDILRVPTNTVGTRLNRGKKMLQKLYLSKGGRHHG